MTQDEDIEISGVAADCRGMPADLIPDWGPPMAQEQQKGADDFRLERTLHIDTGDEELDINVGTTYERLESTISSLHKYMNRRDTEIYRLQGENKSLQARVDELERAQKGVNERYFATKKALDAMKDHVFGGGRLPGKDYHLNPDRRR